MNKLALVLIFTVIFTEFLKMFISFIKTKKFKQIDLPGPGGMPSSHTSLVVALCTSIFLIDGFSNLFIVCVVFSVIIIFDALTLRRTVSNTSFKLGQLLNLDIGERQGHNFLEVVYGMFVGFIIPTIAFNNSVGMTILKSLYFLLPAYFANMSPVLFKDVLGFMAKPIDFGFKFRGQPLFGKNKTFRGVFVGTVVGGLFFYVQKWLYVKGFVALALFDYSTASIAVGFALGFGALIGDAVESFFKRQLKIKSGQPLYFFDQIDYVIGSLLFALIFIEINWVVFGILLVVSPLLTIAVNHLSFYLNIRGEKW